MMSLSLSLSPSSPTHHFASYNKQLCALRSSQSHHTRISQHKLQQSSNFLGYNPLRVSIDLSGEMKMKRRGGVVCYAAALAPRNLQWVCSISSVVLMLAKGTAIHKSFLVPLFALQAPMAVVSWIQGEYGIWTAFLALLVRLFFSFPGELELPFIALLMVIVAPYQVANLSEQKCMEDNETNSHLFLHCRVTSQVWSLFTTLAGESWTMPEHTADLLSCWIRRGGSKSQKRWWKTVPACIWWTIWKERNDRIFNGRSNSIQKIKGKCISTLCFWCKEQCILNEIQIVDFLGCL